MEAIHDGRPLTPVMVQLPGNRTVRIKTLTRWLCRIGYSSFILGIDTMRHRARRGTSTIENIKFFRVLYSVETSKYRVLWDIQEYRLLGRPYPVPYFILTNGQEQSRDTSQGKAWLLIFPPRSEYEGAAAALMIIFCLLFEEIIAWDDRKQGFRLTGT